jgi:hypothetical protein
MLECFRDMRMAPISIGRIKEAEPVIITIQQKL